MIATSFLLFLAVFLIIGLCSAKYSRSNANDYLIADKSVAGWLIGLSAVATNNSGFMFIGMIGLTYRTGLNSMWLMLGWIVGDALANILCVKSIRNAANNEDIHSFGGLLARWYGQNHKLLRVIVGLLTVFFLSIYAAAQLKAGSKAVTALLGWDLWHGTLAGAVIILLYSWAGGIRASIWTDAAQSFVMIFGMALLLIFGCISAAENGPIWGQLSQVSGQYMDLFPDRSWWGCILFILGWIGGGAAIIGQPHVVIRFMALDSINSINRMRVWYYTWFILFYSATIGVGLLARILLPDNSVFDSEIALPLLANQLLSAPFVGLILAALFAATMSTADSQILSCSAAVTRDFRQHKQHSLLAAKLCTISILSISSGLAIWNNAGVFSMVLDAWGMLGSAFAPLIIALSLGQRPRQAIAIAAMLLGVGAFVFWNKHLGLGGTMYSVVPGILVGCIVLAVAAYLQKAEKDSDGYETIKEY